MILHRCAASLTAAQALHLLPRAGCLSRMAAASLGGAHSLCTAAHGRCSILGMLSKPCTQLWSQPHHSWSS